MAQETIEVLYEKATGSRMEIKVAQKQKRVRKSWNRCDIKCF